MRRYELEALLKNFFIFLPLQLFLLWIIYNQSLDSKIKNIDSSLLDKMKICSLTLNCKEFQLDFVLKHSTHEVLKLIKDEDIVYSLFPISQSKSFYMRLFINKEEYLKKIEKTKMALQGEFLIYAVVIAILSFIFSLYSLYPLKRALKLNETFIKDILHDYNTPISSLMINFRLLKREIGENKKIERMERSIESILMLQNDLKYFLSNSELQVQEVSLAEIVKKRIEYFKAMYPDIKFINEVDDIKLKLNGDAFLRVIDNLLSNAAKYNIPQDGYVLIKTHKSSLIIENSSVKIKNPQKIFDRYYKESKRGLGIGLDIVKKLSSEMRIPIKVKTDENKTTFILDLSKVIKDKGQSS